MCCFRSPHLVWGLLVCVQSKMKKLAFVVAWCFCVVGAIAAESPVRFDVLEFVIEGNTVLPGDVVEKAVAPFMGPDKNFKDIESAREALEKAYQDAGFLSVVVSLPNQRVDSGEVRLEVTEAAVGNLNIAGAKYHRPSRLRDQVPSLAEGQTPYFPQVQQELGRLQSADVQVTPLIGAGAEADKIQVDLKVQDSFPLHGSVEVNSRQSFNTTQGRLSAAMNYGNLFQLGHRLGVSWQYAPMRPGDANTLSFIYGVPLSDQEELTASITNSESDTPTNVGAGGSTLTRGSFYGLRWQRELGTLNWPVRHNIFAAIDYKNNRDKSEITDELASEKPPLKYTALSAGYSLTWMGSDDRTVGASTSVTTSTESLSGRQVNCDGRQLDQFECKRQGASPDFLAWKVGLDYRGPAWGRWRINASGDVQVSSGPLASGEQYSLGGPDTVRGYYDYEQSGDWGWNTRLELVSPPWLELGSWRSTALGFYDRGFVLLKEPQAGQVSRVHLGSYGLGWRLENGQGLQVSADVAMPIYETARAADSGGYEAATKREIHWYLSIRQAY